MSNLQRNQLVSEINLFKNPLWPEIRSRISSSKQIALVDKLIKELNAIFEGPFSHWDEASKQCSGYEKKSILEKVLSASLEVQKGNFAFERDSVGFKKPSFDWPLVATFLHEAISKNGTLSILDFGGSLGSSYFQHLPMLSECNLSWHVIEQKHFVEAGKKHFQSESLHFHESIDECISQIEIDVVLLSSVMQYLEDPESTIRHVWQTGANKILIDKTMVNYSDTNRIYLQNVPSSIYNASYPCRSLSEKWLMNQFSDYYQLLADFTSLPFPELKHIDSYFKGFLLQKTA